MSQPVVLIILMLVLLSLPLWQTFRHNKRIRQIREMQSQITVGDEVLTGAGMRGVVSGVNDETVEITISEGVITRWEKSAVLRNLTREASGEVAGNQPQQPLQ